jgi:DNA-3-methyladenine glycosylase II
MDDLELRERRPVRPASGAPRELIFQVKPVPPFRLDLTVRALRRRSTNIVDRWDGDAYRRVILVDHRPIEIEVVQTAPADRPMLQVTARGPELPLGTRRTVMTALTRLLGVDRCLDDFYRLAAREPTLGPLSQAFEGLKPPRFPSLFETLVNAFACQQVTLSLGVLLLNRLSGTYGAGVDGLGGRAIAFPCAHDLAGCEPDELRALGFSRQKARAIIELARAVDSGLLDLAELEEQGDASVVERLATLRGVGRWTAEYVLLRGLGRLHVFPGDDIGARNNLQRWLGILEPLDYDGVRRVLAGWQPFQGLVYLHLLLRALQPEPGEATASARRGHRPLR